MKTRTKGLLIGLIIICLFTLASTYTEPLQVDKAAQNERGVKICISEGNSAEYCRGKLRKAEIINAFVMSE